MKAWYNCKWPFTLDRDVLGRSR
uniref:Uncharacterized protein n=1 Tax=Lepeophtheirus salmonis TaxID=72036 RepID=A0A0K2V3Q2_LEPSM